MSMLSKDLENMLGTKEEFEKTKENPKVKEICSDCCGANVYYLDNAGKSGMCGDCKEWCSIEYLEDEDEDDDLLGDKIRMEYQDNMRDDADDMEANLAEDDLFNEMAMESMKDLGLTEDEAERELEDFKY